MCECGLFIIPLVFQDTYSQYCSDPKPKSHCESIFSPSLQIQYTDKPSRPTFPKDSSSEYLFLPKLPSIFFNPQPLSSSPRLRQQQQLPEGLAVSLLPLWSVLMVANFFFFFISVKLHQLLCQEISEVFLSHLEHTPNSIPDIIINPLLGFMGVLFSPQHTKLAPVSVSALAIPTNISASSHHLQLFPGLMISFQLVTNASSYQKWPLLPHSVAFILHFT